MTASPQSQQMGRATEIISNGRIVWVNGGETGGAIGRFGANGIDVHTADTTGCLHCTHERTTAEDWDVFVAKMAEYHGVDVGDEHKPDRFSVAAPLTGTGSSDA